MLSRNWNFMVQYLRYWAESITSKNSTNLTSDGACQLFVCKKMGGIGGKCLFPKKMGGIGGKTNVKFSFLLSVQFCPASHPQLHICLFSGISPLCWHTESFLKYPSFYFRCERQCKWFRHLLSWQLVWNLHFTIFWVEILITHFYIWHESHLFRSSLAFSSYTGMLGIWKAFIRKDSILIRHHCLNSFDNAPSSSWSWSPSW